MAHCSRSAVWGVALLLLVAAGANGLYVLELVQVAHRGGIAPPPANAPNRSKMCSPNGAGTCASIANRGVEQAGAMGSYIAGIYGRDTETGGSATWFGSQYDPATVYTRASADPFTVQAATALLRGIYVTQNASIAPVIISTPLDRDTLLNVDALPSLNAVNGVALRKSLEAVVDRQFPDFGVVSAMGAEVGLDAVCSVPANRVSCCRRLQQLATMYAATGTSASAPRVMENRDGLDVIAAAHFRELYGYDADVPLKAARGSLGQSLAQEMLHNMRQKMLSKDDTDHNARKVMHYAHNVPLRTTLGHMATDEAPLVETFLVDLLRDNATNAFFVRLRYAAAGTGAPRATPADFPFRCLSAAGVPTGVKSAGGVICPFDDFSRFVASSGGRSGAGAACPDGHVHDPANDSCRPLEIDVGVVSDVWRAFVVAVAVVLGGFLLVTFFLHLCPVCCMWMLAKNIVPSDETPGEFSFHMRVVVQENIKEQQ